MSAEAHGVGATRQGPLRAYSRVYPALAWLVAVVYLGQAVLAGQFLSGSYPALSLHGTGGTVADATVLSALVVAALLRWHAKGRLWPFWASVGLLMANQVQNAAGAGRLISLHIPLGVAMLGVAVGIAVVVSQPGRLTATSSAPRAAEEPEALRSGDERTSGA